MALGGGVGSDLDGFVSPVAEVSILLVPKPPKMVCELVICVGGSSSGFQSLE